MDLITDITPYRARAAQLVTDIIAGRVGAFDEAVELSRQLDERFVKPLRAAYLAVPFQARAYNQVDDLHKRDGIANVVDGLAGMNELGILIDHVNDWCDIDDTMVGRERELADAGVRYRALMAATS